MNRILSKNERRDAVNDDLSLITDKNGLTLGTDALLLASFIRGKGTEKAVELGSGTGILSMLVVTRKKVSSVLAFEIQEKYADLSRRNVEENCLSDRITVKNADIRQLTQSEDLVFGSFDTVFSNPPYMPAVGMRNRTDDNYIARHEVMGDIGDFCHAARKLLRYGGKFFLVHRPDRLSDIMAAMREQRLEPKRMTLVHASPDAAPSLVLIEAVYGGKPDLRITRPFYIYTDETHTRESDDYITVYETGILFPEVNA